MNYTKMTAPCGLDCFNCPVYLMTSGKDPRKNIIIKFLAKTALKIILLLFGKSKSQNIRKLKMLDNVMKIPKERPICKGCRDESGICSLQGKPESCNVYRCAKEKNITFCHECSDFPCDYLHPYSDMASIVPHNTKVFNLCLIKKLGVDKWAEEKAKSVSETYYKSEWKL